MADFDWVYRAKERTMVPFCKLPDCPFQKTHGDHAHVPVPACGYTTAPSRWCNLKIGHDGEHNQDGPPYASDLDA